MKVIDPELPVVEAVTRTYCLIVPDIATNSLVLVEAATFVKDTRSAAEPKPEDASC